MLEIRHLFVSVSGKQVLIDINLKINKGERLALLGPNGSGKTSLLMTIMGYSEYKITQGDIIFKGQRINDFSIDERARLGIGLMLQKPPVIRGIKMRQIVSLIGKSGFDVEREAEALNLKGFLDRDLNLGFSGGELKRSELLQLLASVPSFSLFDEPESGVDLENLSLVGKAMNAILNKHKENAALIITHTGFIFDYVKPSKGCVLTGGRLHCLGDPRGILDTVKEHGYEWCITCERNKPQHGNQRKAGT